MFNLLYNTYHGFLSLFQQIDFNGSSIIKWGIAVFILSSVVRFILPLLGVHLGGGSLFTAVGRAGMYEEPSGYSVTNSTRVAKSYTWDTSKGTWVPGKTRKVVSRTSSKHRGW